MGEWISIEPNWSFLTNQFPCSNTKTVPFTGSIADLSVSDSKPDSDDLSSTIFDRYGAKACSTATATSCFTTAAIFSSFSRPIVDLNSLTFHGFWQANNYVHIVWRSLTFLWKKNDKFVLSWLK